MAVVVLCPGCQQPADVDAIDGKVPFRSECPRCNADLHVCLTCHFYDRQAHNQCREPTADPVGQKDRRNLCDDHRPLAIAAAGPSDSDNAKARLAAAFGGAAPSPSATLAPAGDAAAEAKRKLAALFGKGGSS